MRPEKGRLRSYLLVALRNFLANERQRAMAIRRGQGERPISLDEILAQERAEPQPAQKLTAEQIYEKRWATTVLEQVLTRLEEEYRAAGKTPLFAG